MSTHRYETLDGWRGIAALGVAFYHLPIANPLREMSGWKNLEFFVDFFFVLSGFVIMHAWGTKLAARVELTDFVKRRFWRVWPLHAFVLGAFVAIEIFKVAAAASGKLNFEAAPFTETFSLEALISNLTMVQALNLHGTTTWNGPAWSISVEFWTYLVFAAAVWIFGRRTFVLAGFALVGAIGIILFSSNWMFATHDFGMFRAIFGFFMGALTYQLISGSSSSGKFGSGTEIAAILAKALWMATTGSNASSLAAPLVFSAMVVVFARGEGVVTRLVNTRFIQNLGLWSYSLYLVHTLVYYVMRLMLVAMEKLFGIHLTHSGQESARVFTMGSTALDAGWIAVMLIAMIFVAKYSYRFVEKPFIVSGAKTGAPVSMGLQPV